MNSKVFFFIYLIEATPKILHLLGLPYDIHFTFCFKTLNYSSRKTQTVLLVLCVIFLFNGCADLSRTRLRKANIVIQTARSYNGVPYRFGGMNRAGMDCSALLYHSFRSVKIRLPRQSKDQAKTGKKVRLKNLQPGDMLFFATGRHKNRISHAGIVTEVRGKRNVRFIHASTSRGVTESSLYAKYYRKRFKRARRVL